VPRFVLAHGVRSPTEVERALVTLTAMPGGEPRCVGTVIGFNTRESLVLTAAHCLQAQTRGTLFVEAAIGQPTPVRVTQSWVHPRFVPRVVTSSYDAALLAMPRLAGMSAASLAEGTVGSGVISILLREARAAPHARIERIRVNEVQSLLLSFTRTADRVCHGASGAPVVSEHAKWGASHRRGEPWNEGLHR
jgi:hypothetical protein